MYIVTEEASKTTKKYRLTFIHVMIYQIDTYAWFGKQYNALVGYYCILSFTPDALIVTTSNTIPLIYASKYT